MSEYEGQIVRHVFGRWVRVYLGHSIHSGRRLRRWRSDLSQGVFVVPWGDRVIGLQWRRLNEYDA